MIDRNAAMVIWEQCTCDAVLLLDASHHLAWFNSRAAFLFTNLSHTGLHAGQQVEALLPTPEASLARRIAEILRRRPQVRVELRVSDGQNHPHLFSCCCKKIDFNGNEHTAVVLTDITKNLERQFHLSRLQPRIENIMVQQPEGLLVTDEQGRLLEADITGSALLQLGERHQFLRRNIYELVPASERPGLMAHFVDLFKHSEAKTQLQYNSENGKRWIEIKSVKYEKSFQQTSFALSIVNDITSIKKSEEALKIAVRKLEAVIDSSPDVICVLNNNGEFQQLSNACVNMWGYTPAELTGKRLLPLVIPEDRNKTIAAKLQVQYSGSRSDFNNRMLKKDGSLITVNWSAKYDPDTQQFFCIGRDVTLKEITEARLKSSEERYRTLFDKSPLPKWLFDRKAYHFLEVNNEALLQYGYTREEYRQMTADQLYAPALREAFRQMISEIDAANPQKKFTLRQFTKTNRQLVVEASFHLLEFEGREVILSMANDITQRLRAQKERRKASERYHLARQATFDGIWEWEVAKDELTWAEGYSFLFGYDDDKRKFGDFTSLVHPEDRQRIESRFNEIVFASDNSHWIDEYRFCKADGAYAYVRDRAIILRNKNKQPVRLIGAVQDITQQKKAEIELISLNSQLLAQTQKLSESNHELERFAYVASHDLQEPLRTVSNFVQLLQTKYGNRFDEKAERYMNFILEATTHMRHLIANLLDYSRLTTATETMQPVNMNEVVERILRMYQQRFKKMEAQVLVETLPLVNGHPAMLMQLFQNLISNALKYHGEQPPQIQIGADENKSHWSFFVKDNGIGIKPEFSEKIFGIFQRLHTRDEYPGTGIGLAVCKKIAEKHGGDIWVHSLPGEGSTFHFTIKKPITKS